MRAECRPEGRARALTHLMADRRLTHPRALRRDPQPLGGAAPTLPPGKQHRAIRRQIVLQVWRQTGWKSQFQDPMGLGFRRREDQPPVLPPAQQVLAAGNRREIAPPDGSVRNFVCGVA
jgi:hypothetical protein